MPRKPYKYHYLYKTTNLINNKFYVGMHSTDNLDDGYLGSGKYLKRSIKKYGKDNFRFEILEFFENRKSLKEKEKDYVNENFIHESLCMNLKQGGDGGFCNKEHMIKCSIAGIIQLKYLKENNLEWNKKRCKNVSIGIKKSYKKGRKINCLNKFKGKTHKESSKKKIGIKNSIKQKGNNNSQYGTCWIYNIKLKENKKIKKNELTKWLNLGWQSGRKIKF